ncbi:MAG TPA: transketolase [Salinivirga sp.]|uniref:transketolase n=1 Tax=Salinivirga sp. TaxID=1970192 RepID=UPI002B4A2BC4|nr:transketolase [Salinivirga sp.]HKK59246.1 transketolase [Salinivirga sp.]
MKLSVRQLREKAMEIRISVINSLAAAGSGHLGGSLGLADVFTSLYFKELNHKPENPEWENRDRLVLSIGHVAPIFYTTLAHCGYFSVEELSTLRKLGSRLQGHPATDHHTPGLETSAGSLGQGLSIATGMALAAKHNGANHRIFSIHGDGELQEGAIWEAAMAAGNYQLDNMVAIVDRNGVQIDGPTEQVMGVEPLVDKWRAFNWKVHECNGNDIIDILRCFDVVKEATNQPQVIIAHTKMGAGVVEIENDYTWHGKPPRPENVDNFIAQVKQNYHENS